EDDLVRWRTWDSGPTGRVPCCGGQTAATRRRREADSSRYLRSEVLPIPCEMGEFQHRSFDGSRHPPRLKLPHGDTVLLPDMAAADGQSMNGRDSVGFPPARGTGAEHALNDHRRDIARDLLQVRASGRAAETPVEFPGEALAHRHSHQAGDGVRDERALCV